MAESTRPGEPPGGPASVRLPAGITPGGHLMVGAGHAASASSAIAGAESAEVRKVSIHAGRSRVGGAECSAGSAECFKATRPRRSAGVRPSCVRFGQLARQDGRGRRRRKGGRFHSFALSFTRPTCVNRSQLTNPPGDPLAKLRGSNYPRSEVPGRTRTGGRCGHGKTSSDPHPASS